VKKTACTLMFILLVSPFANAQYTPDGEAYNRSYGAEAVGNYEQALKELNGLTATAKTNYIFQLRRGWLLYLSAQYESSVEAYQKASTIAGTSAIEPLLGEMLPLMGLRRWKDAEAVGAAILKITPKNALVIGRLAWCQYNLGRFKEAETSYRQVLAQFPGDLDIRAGLGWALMKQNDKAAAAKEFRAVLDVAPSHDSAQQGLAATK